MRSLSGSDGKEALPAQAHRLPVAASSSCSCCRACSQALFRARFERSIHFWAYFGRSPRSRAGFRHLRAFRATFGHPFRSRAAFVRSEARKRPDVARQPRECPDCARRRSKCPDCARQPGERQISPERPSARGASGGPVRAMRRNERRGGCPPSNLRTACILKMWISAGCQGASEVLLAIRPADAYHSDRIARLLSVIRLAATASAVR